MNTAPAPRPKSPAPATFSALQPGRSGLGLRQIDLPLPQPERNEPLIEVQRFARGDADVALARLRRGEDQGTAM